MVLGWLRVDTGSEVVLTKEQHLSLFSRLDYMMDEVYLKGNRVTKDFFRGYVEALCEVGILTDDEFDLWMKRLNELGGLRA